MTLSLSLFSASRQIEPCTLYSRRSVLERQVLGGQSRTRAWNYQGEAPPANLGKESGVGAAVSNAQTWRGKGKERTESERDRGEDPARGQVQSAMTQRRRAGGPVA